MSDGARIACIYFPTSSVGGINSVLVALTRQAAAVGDRVDVLACDKWVSKTPQRFPESKLIRGGDTYITIHGECSHHPAQIAGTIEWLERNYDAILFSTICPHPTKAYGEVPHFLPLYTHTKLPKLAMIHDAYWSTYADWALQAMPYVDRTLVCQKAYFNGLSGAEHLPTGTFSLPIFPEPVRAHRDAEYPLVVWTSQQKNIKGWEPFLSAVPEITKTHRVEIYSCGIDYYKLRTEPVWLNAVGKDHFKGFNGSGKAEYFGYVSLGDIPNVLTRAWVMVDLQGLKKPKYGAYQNGSVNMTTLEALYYGACPVLAEQALKSHIPSDLFLTVTDSKDIAPLINAERDFILSPDRRAAARRFIEENHSPELFYNQIIDAFN